MASILFRAAAACALVLALAVNATASAQTASPSPSPSLSPSAAPAPGTCIPIAVQMLDDVDSATAKAGDFFRFETAGETTTAVGYRRDIPAHTVGYGIVVIASAAASGGRAGTLVLEPRYLVLPGGTHLQVVLDHVASDPQSKGSSGDLPGYLGAIPIVGPAIGIFNVFHRGKNVEVVPGTRFAVFASDSPSVAKCQRETGDEM